MCIYVYIYMYIYIYTMHDVNEVTVFVNYLYHVGFSMVLKVSIVPPETRDSFHESNHYMV